MQGATLMAFGLVGELAFALAMTASGARAVDSPGATCMQGP